MIGSIYNGMAGLQAFAKGLDTISSNVSNMNTPGYKSLELQFLDVFYRSQYFASSNGDTSFSSDGNGVATGGTNTRFSAGEIRSTGEDLDLAIDGNGFLILVKDGETLYTRAGQMEFSDQGYLISRQNQGRVMGITEAGELVEINQSQFSFMEREPTQQVLFAGTLRTGYTNSGGDHLHEVDNIIVYDEMGERRTLRAEFELTNASSFAWTVRVYEDTTLIGSGDIAYDSSGNPLEDSHQFNFDLTAANGEVSSVTFNMGAPDAPEASSSTPGSTASDLRVSDIDGFAAGTLITTSIDALGVLTANYSNGQTEEVGQLALASFLQLQELDQRSGGTFAAGDATPILGKADDGVMGRFINRAIELSNVDLTQQFGDLIIVQRGYQAASQILTVSNEMLQQLIEMRGK